MAARSKMELNQHFRSRANRPIETASRMKRNRKRNYTKEIHNGGSKEVR